MVVLHNQCNGIKMTISYHNSTWCNISYSKMYVSWPTAGVKLFLSCIAYQSIGGTN